MEHSQPQGHPPKSLVIVGAGMAGIKFAHYYLQHIPDACVTILEANDYVGGRMRSRSFQGHTVEMGANWISGLETTYANPVWKLARDVDLNGHLSDRSDAIHVVDEVGNNVTPEYLEALQRFETIYERAIKCCGERGIESYNDIDARSFLEELGWKERELSNIDRAVEFNVLEVWLADSIEHLSVAHDMRDGANDVELSKEEFFVEDSRGFNCILDNMIEDIKSKGGTIKLNNNVEQIHYSPGNVKVIAKDIKTGDIFEYPAGVIVCTVSLGVLQGNKLDFFPALPKWKTVALDEIRMGVFSKVYVKFDEVFWGDQDQIIVCGKKKGHYPLWMKYRNVNLFMCYLGGDEAKRVEALSQKEIKDEVEELFKNAYTHHLKAGQCPTIFRPSAVAVTDWSTNPRFLGSYSYFPVHSFAKVPIDDLTHGLTGTEAKEGPNTLTFAGECFDDRFNGWIQGAYRSGERVAKSLLD